MWALAVCLKYSPIDKGIVFFFYCKSSFFTHFGGKSIEWIKKLYFFFQRQKKNTASRSIEWMAYELLQENKKHKKNTQNSPLYACYESFTKNRNSEETKSARKPEKCT